MAIKIFYKKLFVSYNGNQNNNAPTIFIANHPNSFFDAILLGVLLKQPINTLTRGDMFSIKLLKPILAAMKLIPIYRIRDGKNSLFHNDTSFKACIKIFNNNGSVLIFGEAKCDGQYALLPLQKGGIKIAMDAWQTNSIANTVKVIPVAINYSNLFGWRKIGTVIFGAPILKPKVELLPEEVPFLVNAMRKNLNVFFDKNLIQHKAINELEKKRWNNLFAKNGNALNAEDFVANVNSDIQNNKDFKVKFDFAKIIILIFYWPLFCITAWAAKKANAIGKVHYDSLLICFSLLSFGLYYLVIFLLSMVYFTKTIAAFIIFMVVLVLLLGSKKINA